MKSKPLAVLFTMTAVSITTAIPATAQGETFRHFNLKLNYPQPNHLAQQLKTIKVERINPSWKARQEGTTKPPRDLTGLSPLRL